MTASPHILLVDDDPLLTAMVAEYLEDFEMRVSQTASSTGMRKVLEHQVVDLVVLDLKLNREDGMIVLREMRTTTNVPVVVLTVRDDPTDRVLALEFGADDYLTKPFNLRELLARIRTVLRRTLTEPLQPDQNSPRAYRFAGWHLEIGMRRLTSSHGTVELTYSEYQLLVAFLSAPQRILSREQLLRMIRHSSNDLFDRSIDVQILRLRRKIEADPSRPQLIKTERGLGYSFGGNVELVF